MSYVPNYVKKLAKMEHKPGLYKTTILHDDWCHIWKNGICNCNFEIKIEKIKPEKKSKKH